ncbi:MAG: DUF2384 domain-containing protein [Elusimicrobiota bacterium]|nr:DUF2384 domain-containing protein [Elusimicrobiota bacterium]
MTHKKGKETRTRGTAAAEPQRLYLGDRAEETNVILTIRRGFDYSEIQNVQHAYQMPDKSFAHLIGISDKTLLRIKKAHAKLSSMSGDRLYRLKKVWDLANKVLGTTEKALPWLRRSQPGLGNQAPLDILDTEPGYEQVQTLLNRIEFGVLP